jgi:carbonic anhydrase
MYSRRTFMAGLSTSTFITVTGTGVLPVSAQEACAVFTPDRQKAISPEEALKRLKDGNARFVAGQTINCDLMKQVKETAKGQAPYAVILGCIDSRVPPELVFDQRIGDVFAARIAGNFINDDIIGSLEFATKVAGAKAVVVLGHTECGAIKGAIDKAKLGLLTKMLSKFDDAVASAKNVPGEKSSKNKELVQAVADTNAKQAADLLVKRSKVLGDMVKTKQIIVTSAMHDLATGKVTFFA